jgi:hypothetical protein
MPEWIWLCVSVLGNGLLALYAVRRKREANVARRDAAAQKLTTAVLAREIERKYGPRKAMRMARATETTLRQQLAPKESEA